jgi:hypothetical protein
MVRVFNSVNYRGVNCYLLNQKTQEKMKVLKTVGKFLATLVRVNTGITLPGSQTIEAEKTSPLFHLNINDFVKGLVVIVATSVITALAEYHYSSINWDDVKNVAWISFTGYIVKQFCTPEQTILKK